jgi:enoyl-CoA hydratase/carnithine racemase
LPRLQADRPRGLRFGPESNLYCVAQDEVVAFDFATGAFLETPEPHFEFGIVSGDGVHLLWQEAIGTIRGRYFILTRQELDVQTAKEWGAVNEIVPADKLLPRAREIAEGLAKLPPLTTSYTRIAMTQKLRRIIDEGVTLGLALEGISAADVARARTK